MLLPHPRAPIDRANWRFTHLDELLDSRIAVCSFPTNPPVCTFLLQQLIVSFFALLDAINKALFALCICVLWRAAYSSALLSQDSSCLPVVDRVSRTIPKVCSAGVQHLVFHILPFRLGDLVESTLSVCRRSTRLVNPQLATFLRERVV